LAEIIWLEETLNRLLPEFRLEERPGAELLTAVDRWAGAVWSAAEAAGPSPLTDSDLAAGFRLSERAVFVCGVHRSGTTLLRDLLDGHPQLSVLPAEGSYLTGWRAKLAPLPRDERIRALGCEWLRRLANPINQAPFWLLGRTTPESSPYIQFARRFIAWWSALEHHFAEPGALLPLMSVALAYASCAPAPGRLAEAQRWVEKTPTNEFHLDSIWAALPSAKVIHVIRDPIAVYASHKRLEERYFGSFRSARQALRNLARSFEIACKHHARNGPHGYLLVRYEDLIAEPEEVMGRIASFLEIARHASLLRPTAAGRPAYPNSSFYRTERAGAILAHSPDSRCQSLADWEQELVAAYIGGTAESLGYRMKALGITRKMQLKTAFLFREIGRRLKNQLTTRSAEDAETRR
jgi:hypothetical protein